MLECFFGSLIIYENKILLDNLRNIVYRPVMSIKPISTDSSFVMTKLMVQFGTEAELWTKCVTIIQGFNKLIGNLSLERESINESIPSRIQLVHSADKVIYTPVQALSISLDQLAVLPQSTLDNVYRTF